LVEDGAIYQNENYEEALTNPERSEGSPTVKHSYWGSFAHPTFSTGSRLRKQKLPGFHPAVFVFISIL